jgi:nitric oxide reductase NorE protein
MTVESVRAKPTGTGLPAHPQQGHIPGEVGIWIFVLTDILLEFSTIFALFLVKRAADPAVFARSRATLNPHLGLVNTLLLLTSSLFVALAIQALRRGERDRAAALFVWARGLGLGFVMVKVLEYVLKVASGLTPMTNSFYMYYFAATGLHLVHVLIGIAYLTYVLNGARRYAARPHELRSAEITATFWHMVDLVWIILFPLLYLVS